MTEKQIKEIYGSREAYEQHKAYADRSDEIEQQRESHRKRNKWLAINLLSFGMIPIIGVGGIALVVLALFGWILGC